MPSRSRLLRLCLGSAAAALVVGFLIANASGLLDVGRAVAAADHRLTALGLACSVVAIVNRGLLNTTSHRVVGLDAELVEMTQTAAVGFAAAKIVKPGAIAGLTVFIQHGRRRGHAAASVTAACVVSAAAAFASLGVLLVAAVAVLAVRGELTGWWGAASIGFGVYTAAIATFGVAVARNRSAAARIARLLHCVRRRWSPAALDGADGPTTLDQLVAGVAAVRREGMVSRLVVVATVSKLLGASMLLAAMGAAGLPPSPSEALVIYATVLATSMVSIVPGGVGVVEGSTAGLLIAAGAPAGSAALAVALFRLFDLWFPLLVGGAMTRCAPRLSRSRTARQRIVAAPIAVPTRRARASVR
jgi:uncharacterized protein (TIRG00374 family)